MQKFDLEQKLLAILIFCLFKRNCRLAALPLKDSKNLTKKIEKFLGKL